MALDGYDLEDPLIREMIRLNHAPCEEILGTSQGTTVLSVQCQRCGSPWPCPQITAYRDWEAARPQSIMTSSSE